ncbi:MAG: ROK family protein [Verrucomicrobia bacterium]|jgi:glucokinase|nr:ROK family protein [Verrucomicrobiota bacterium]
MSPLLGIDLGGTRIKYVVISNDGDLLLKKTHDFDSVKSLEWSRCIGSLTKDVINQFNLNDLRIGLSAPGLVAKDQRSIRHMPGRLQGLEGLDWTEILKSHHPVKVINDAQAALMGEVQRGVAKGMINVIMITLGTGVGGAAMVDGNLLKGHLGRAGHLGHVSLKIDGPPDICRTPGSLEWAIGNYSVKERSQGRFESTHDLVNACLQGDTFATNIWHQSVQYLATGITSLINVLDPEAIIIGGGIAESGEALFHPLQTALDDMEWIVQDHRVRIIKATLGEYAGAYGAAFSARID